MSDQQSGSAPNRSPPRERERSPPRRRSRSRSRSPPRGGGGGGSGKLTGIAARWNERGFGFIKPDDGGEVIAAPVFALGRPRHKTRVLNAPTPQPAACAPRCRPALSFAVARVPFATEEKLLIDGLFAGRAVLAPLPRGTPTPRAGERARVVLVGRGSSATRLCSSGLCSLPKSCSGGLKNMLSNPKPLGARCSLS